MMRNSQFYMIYSPYILFFSVSLACFKNNDATLQQRIREPLIVHVWSSPVLQ